MKPLLKHFRMLAGNGEVVLGREVGSQWTLPDPHGQVLALLQLLDGSLTLDEVERALSLRWPDLTREQVAEVIIRLDEAGLLEDEAACSELSLWQLERYAHNLTFFSTFASLRKSRYRFQEELTHAHVVLLGVRGLGSALPGNLAGLGVGHIKLHHSVDRIRTLRLDDADLVICGIDTSAPVLDWVNEACVRVGVPWIAGGLLASRGLYYSVNPGRSGCLACLRQWERRHPDDGPTPGVPEQASQGMAAVATLMGATVALEALRYLTHFAPPVSAGKFWIVDFATGQAAMAREWPRQGDCPVCGHLTGRENR